MKSWNLAFRLICLWRIRWCSHNFKIFKIYTQLWRHRVTWGPKIPQKGSNVNTFSMKRRIERLKFDIYYTFVMEISMLESNFQKFQTLDPTVTSHPKIPPKGSNVNNFSMKGIEMLKFGICNNFVMGNSRVESKFQNLVPTVTSQCPLGSQNTPQKSQMLITSQGNGMKSWNLAFRLICSWGIRWLSHNFNIFKMYTQLWRHRVPGVPKYPKKGQMLTS